MGWKAIGFEQKNLDELPLAAMNPFRVIEEDGKIGVEHYFTLQRRTIIPAEYDYIEQVYVSEGIFFIVGINKKYGVYNSEGELIVKIIYDKICVEDKIIITRINRFRGVYDFYGNHIVPHKYSEITVYEDYIIVHVSKKTLGIYDLKGNHIAPDSFTEWRTVRFNKDFEMFFFVKNSKGECGLYNKKGKDIVPVTYTQITICENFIIADNSYSSAAYDYEGNQILPISETYRYVSYMGKLILQGTGNGTKVYDKTGKEIEHGIVYEEVFMQHDEFLAVKFDGHWRILYSV